MNTYTMVGAGGTGTHLLPALHTYLLNKHGEDFVLHIIDGDEVEQKNLERQLFRPGDITLNKATAAASGRVGVVGHATYLSEENMENFIRDGDVIFICVDNFTVRKRIEEHALKLKNVVIINGGNEAYEGSVQLMVREKNKPVTPRIGYLHPEIAVGMVDRAEMTCQQAAALPGGDQTLISNMMSATYMLATLWRYHNNLHIGEASPKTWTELQFDIRNGTVEHIDQRITSHWMK